MLCKVVEALPQKITAVVSDGQVSIRNAVAQVLPGIPHQLCHYDYYKEAFKPIIEADRHAKKELKKLVRGVRLHKRLTQIHSSLGGVEKVFCPRGGLLRVRTEQAMIRPI